MKLFDGGFDRDCYVIAEIGVNHNGSVELARELIHAASAAGADAVKFQTFFADDLVTRTAPKAAYQAKNAGAEGTQHEMLSQLELEETDFAELLAECLTIGIDFLSTPFSFAAADLLERIGVTGFKVSSGDLTYLQFLRHLASKGLPMIISTGMATLAEVENALGAIDAIAPVPVAILHCVSNYPAAIEDCNLRAMATMERAFGRVVGWSDHTLGSTIGTAAVALGARIVEKHITLDRELAGPDHAASMEPAEFADFVAAIRSVESAFGDGIKRPTPAEVETALVARRSVVATRPLAPGDVLARSDVAVLRPGSGIEPELLNLVIGRPVGRPVAEGAPITVADLQGAASPSVSDQC